MAPAPNSATCARRWPLLLGALLAASSLACEGRPRATSGAAADTVEAGEPHVAELDLSEGVRESSRTSLFGGSREDSFADLVTHLRGIEQDDDLKGVFVRLGSAELGLARATEVGRHLARVRGAGRPVVCHADGYGNGTMLLAASGCDEIWITPAGMVDTVGLAAQLVFGRSLLDKLEVDVDFLQVGKYKGASEPFTRDSASPEARQSLETALFGMRGAWIDTIEAGRGKSASELRLEDGPHTAREAKELGLVDELGFEQDARSRAIARAGVKGKIDYYGGHEPGGDGLVDLVRLLSEGGGAQVPHVAVLTAVGGITMRDGGSLLGSSDGITERRLGKQLRALQGDDSVKAVVLRIDSPGGSVLASDLLWRALMDLRQSKPVVVSIGAMAASGGYYLACTGTKVVAEQVSLIGSIGVVAGKLSFATSLEAVGIHVEPVPAKPGHTRALYGSPLSPWDEPTRERVLGAIEDAYQRFIERIAEGRSLGADAIGPAAEGRVMAGEDAKRHGLIDEIGGLDRAIALAVELSGAGQDVPVRVIRTPGGLLELMGLDSAEARRAASQELERQAGLRLARALTTSLLPLQQELLAFGVSTTPLLQGELLVAALPYALAVR